jgi:prefoldin subunit 5
VVAEDNIKKMADRIRSLRQKATELKEMSGGIQAVDRNVDRILASIRMLEINISDVADLM